MLSAQWIRKVGFIVLLPIIGLADQGPLACPADMRSETLENWRNVAIKRAVGGEITPIDDALKSCFGNQIPACMKDLNYHVQSNKFGYQNIDDYTFADEDYLTLKSPADLPPEFLPKDAHGAVIPDAIRMPANLFQIAKAKGWEAISYKTRSTGGFDSPSNLLLVVIPGATKDIYLQISPPPDANADQTKNDPKPLNPLNTQGQNTLTVITVDKSKSPPLGQLKKFSQDSITKAYKWSKYLESQNCIECHSKPLRSISPLGYRVVHGAEKRMSPQDEATVTRINQMMVVENLSWGEKKTENGYARRGPPPSAQPYGWAPPNSETRTEAYIKQCATSSRSVYYSGFGNYNVDLKMSDNPNIDYRKVSDSMNCVQCHDGTVRGPLHARFSKSEINFKVMVDQSMPPGSDLNPDERMALVNCLSAEMTNPNVIESWKSRAEWLKGVQCESARMPGRMNPMGAPVNRMAPLAPQIPPNGGH